MTTCLLKSETWAIDSVPSGDAQGDQKWNRNFRKCGWREPEKKVDIEWCQYQLLRKTGGGWEGWMKAEIQCLHPSQTLTLVVPAKNFWVQTWQDYPVRLLTPIQSFCAGFQFFFVIFPCSSCFLVFSDFLFLFSSPPLNWFRCWFGPFVLRTEGTHNCWSDVSLLCRYFFLPGFSGTRT